MLIQKNISLDFTGCVFSGWFKQLKQALPTFWFFFKKYLGSTLTFPQHLLTSGQIWCQYMTDSFFVQASKNHSVRFICILCTIQRVYKTVNNEAAPRQSQHMGFIQRIRDAKQGRDGLAPILLQENNIQPFVCIPSRFIWFEFIGT